MPIANSAIAPSKMEEWSTCKSQVVPFRKRRYTKVLLNTWHDAKFKKLSAPPPNAQTLWLRVMTAPESDRIPGLFFVTIQQLAHTLGWDVEATRKCWQEIEQQEMGFADWDAGLVWIPQGVSNNPPTNPNVVKGWYKHWDNLPKCGLLYQAWMKLGELVALRGPKWHDAFKQASDIIFEGEASETDLQEIEACLGNRVIELPFASMPTERSIPIESKQGVLPSLQENNLPIDNDAKPPAPENQDLFPEESAKPSKKKPTRKDPTPSPETCQTIAQALEKALRIAWEGEERKTVSRNKLRPNEKINLAKLLREDYSVEDIVRVILRKGEDAYRNPFYEDRYGNQHSNRALVTLEHIARPGKMDRYLQCDELDEHKKPKKKISGPMTTDEYKELIRSIPAEFTAPPPGYSPEEAMRLMRESASM